MSGLVLPLPPGARLPTAEFDCIIVCEAGVYLFEVKGWDRCLVGHDKLEGGANQWYLQQPCGQRHLVADPIVQGIEKMQALKTYLDPRIAVRSYVMLPCGEVQVCPTLPASVLTSQEVDYLPRMCKAATKASKCCQRLDDETVDIVADVIQALSGGLTLAGHIANCQRFELQKKATRATPRPCDALALLLPAAPLAASLVSG